MRLHWSSGTVTEHQVTRAVRRWEHVADAAVLWERVQGWRSEGWTARRMAETLNAAGYQTPRGRPFTSESVRQLLARGGPRGRKRCPEVSPGRPARQAARARAEAMRVLAAASRIGPPNVASLCEPSECLDRRLAHHRPPRRRNAGASVLNRRKSINYALDQTLNPSKSL